MICLHCNHYINPDSEMARVQESNNCKCDCHPWNKEVREIANPSDDKEDASHDQP